MTKRKLETKLAEIQQTAQRIKTDLEATHKAFLDATIDRVRNAHRHPRSDTHGKIALRYHDDKSSLKDLDFAAFVTLYRHCTYKDLVQLSRLPLPADFSSRVGEAKVPEKPKAEDYLVQLFRDILSIGKTCPPCSARFHSGMSTPVSLKTRVKVTYLARDFPLMSSRDVEHSSSPSTFDDSERLPSVHPRIITKLSTEWTTPLRSNHSTRRGSSSFQCSSVEPEPQFPRRSYNGWAGYDFVSVADDVRHGLGNDDKSGARCVHRYRVFSSVASSAYNAPGARGRKTHRTDRSTQENPENGR